MSTRRYGNRSQAGSLPLALLVAIIIGGLVVVLVARTLTAQDQVRFDQTYHGALPAADAAVEIGKFHLNEGIELMHETEGLTHPRDFAPGDSTALLDDEFDGRTVEWTMTKETAMRWRVNAVTTDPRTGVQRRVRATIDERPLVDVAAFADTVLSFRGANTADSYTSRGGEQDWCTGRGWVASNNDVDFQGVAAGDCQAADGFNQRSVDQVFLYNWGPEEGDNPGTVTDPERPGGDRCDDDSNHDNCREIDPKYLAPLLIDPPLDLSSDANNEDFIEKALAECDVVEREFRATNYVGNQGILDDDGNLQPAEKAEEAMVGPEFDLSGGHYCFDRVVFDRDIDVSDDAGLKSPVIIFVRDEVILDRGPGAPAGGRNVDVGCPVGVGCVRGPDADETYPEAASLIIFVLKGDVSLRNQSQFAGVMYAPKALCHGPQSNAQADIYGAMMCDTITNAGGWRFHYDDALADLASGNFSRSEWLELPS